MQIIDRKIQIVAAVALIDVDGRILISKRPENKYLGGLWEFPGGKLENKERAEDALIRELDEELNIQTWKSCLAPLTFSHMTIQTLIFYYCYLFVENGMELLWEGKAKKLNGFS